jgi:hypothetical protein
MRALLFYGMAFMLFSMAGCLTGYKQFTDEYIAVTDTVVDKSVGLPDYSNLYYWAAHPDKHDPSDSLTPALRAGFHKDSTVDVFFVHPSTYTLKKYKGWNADINDPIINAKTDYGPVLYQASAFNEYQLYAPRYRQAHIRSYFTTDTAMATRAFDLAYADVKDAFQYYLDHYNHGRPIILAGHSQGTSHALRLLKDFFENTNLKNRLVVAYIPGVAIPGNYFTKLPLCKTPEQTGCVCGWRTYRTGYVPDWIKKEPVQSWVVNPITWTETDTPATRSMNKGAILRKFNKKRFNVADAQISGGVLWTHRPRFPLSFLIPLKDYHIGDINFYYFNIRDNVHTRVGTFWKR